MLKWTVNFNNDAHAKFGLKFGLKYTGEQDVAILDLQLPLNTIKFGNYTLYV